MAFGHKQNYRNNENIRDGRVSRLSGRSMVRRVGRAQEIFRAVKLIL
jgi:hypothetical protein